MGALIRTANKFQNSDFPTPRGYEQAVHPPFNLKSVSADSVNPHIPRGVTLIERLRSPSGAKQHAPALKPCLALCFPHQQQQRTKADGAEFTRAKLLVEGSGEGRRQSGSKSKEEEREHKCGVYDDVGPKLHDDRARLVPHEERKVEGVVVSLKIIVGVVEVHGKAGSRQQVAVCSVSCELPREKRCA